MKVKVEEVTGWGLALSAARFTVNKDVINRVPTDKFIEGICQSEHSPLRCKMFAIYMYDIPYFVSVHLTRHKIGVEHFVGTQRTDRTGQDRNGKRQDAPVNHMMLINAQALMTMARRRLCSCASKETRELMNLIVKDVKRVCPELAKHLVPMCVYRGGICHEQNGCGLYPKEYLY